MSDKLDARTHKSYTYLKEVEEKAQEILTYKQTKMEIANAQNKYREAFRALHEIQDRQSWIKIGSVYVQLPTNECKEILKQNIDGAADDLDNLHGKIRNSVCQLRDLEHEPRLEGIDLKPMSFVEAKALHKGFGS